MSDYFNSVERQRINFLILKFRGHFSFDSNHKLQCSFCHLPVCPNDDSLVDHLVSDEHCRTLVQHYASKHNLSHSVHHSGAKKRKRSPFSNITNENEAIQFAQDRVALSTIGQLPCDDSEDLIGESPNESDHDKLEVVKRAIEDEVIACRPGDLVHCTLCGVDQPDSLSRIREHLDSYGHKANERDKLRSLHTRGVIQLVKQNKYLRYAGEKVQCLACNHLFASKKSTLYDHLKSQKHTNNEDKYQDRIKNAESVTDREFVLWLALMMSANNIPLNKIKGMRTFLEAFTGRSIPEVSTLRTYLEEAASMIKQRTLAEIGDHDLFISMDEATNSRHCTKFVCVVVGTLIPDEPDKQKVFVLDYYQVDNNKWDTNAVVNMYLQSMRQLFGLRWYREANRRVKLFVTDGGSQMVSAAENLKMSNNFPGLIHFTCLCHGLHNLACTIISEYKNVKDFVVFANSFLYSSPKRMHAFKVKHKVGTPPKFIESRWGLGLRAIKYWRDNLAYARETLATLCDSKEDCATLREIKKLFANYESLKVAFDTIIERYLFIANIINKLETRNLGIVKSIELVDKVMTKIKQYEHTDLVGTRIVARLEGILDNNKGYIALKKEIHTDKYRALLFAPIGSYECERGIKMFKTTLSANRTKFKFDNIRHNALIRFNSISLQLRDIRNKRKSDQRTVDSDTRNNSFSALFVR